MHVPFFGRFVCRVEPHDHHRGHLIHALRCARGWAGLSLFGNECTGSVQPTSSTLGLQCAAGLRVGRDSAYKQSIPLLLLCWPLPRRGHRGARGCGAEEAGQVGGAAQGRRGAAGLRLRLAGPAVKGRMHACHDMERGAVRWCTTSGGTADAMWTPTLQERNHYEPLVLCQLGPANACRVPV